MWGSSWGRVSEPRIQLFWKWARLAVNARSLPWWKLRQEVTGLVSGK